MATETEQLVVSLEARFRDFEKSFERANRTANSQFSAIEKRAKEAADRMERLMSSTALTVNRALGAIGVGLGFEEIRRFADAWTEAGNKIRAAAAATGIQVRSLDQLKKGANDARTSLEGCVDLYARLTRAAAGVAKSEDEIARVTAITAKAFKAGGSSSQEAAGAALQLGQALGSGVLQGDELRSLKESAPILAQAIADAFGVPLAALKSLGEQGKLTSDKVFGAILAAQAKVETQFAATSATIEDSLTRLQNEFTAYIGTMAEAHGISAAFRSLIENLAGHVDAVANGAAAVAAVLLTRYVPALVRTAAAQAAVVATNPWLAIAAAVGAAAAAMTLFGDEIHPIAGDLATLGDYAAVAWEEIRAGAQTAAAGIGNVFTTIVDFAAGAMNSVGTSWQDVADMARWAANAVVNSFALVYDTIAATFSKLPQAVADTAISAMNGLISKIESALNTVIEAVNTAVEAINSVGGKVGVELGTIGRVTLERIQNAYAGAGAAAGQAYGDALSQMTRDRVGEALAGINRQADAALEAWRRRANERAKADTAGVDHSAPIGGTRATMPLDSVKEVTDLQAKIVALRAEMALRRSISGSLEQIEAALERQKVAQELVNAATKAGVAMNDDTKNKIGALADAYSRASQEARALAKSQEEAAQKAADLANTSRDTFKGFVSDLVHGKSASDALASALGKIGDRLLDMTMDQMWKSVVMDNGGTGFFGSLGGLFTSPTKPAYAPGSALQGVNFNPAGINTPTAVVNAGTVSVNGATIGGTAGATNGTGIFADSTLNRSSFDAELSNPDVVRRLYAMTNAEVGGQGSAAQQAFMETIFNRASARNMSLASVLNDRGYFPAETFANADRFMTDPTMESKYAAMLAQVRAGSNISNYATGNASGSVGFGGGPQTFTAGGEKFGIEKPDMAWATRMQQQAQAFAASTTQAGQSLSDLGQKATSITDPVTQAADATQNLGEKANTATPQISNMSTNTAQLTPQLQQGATGLEGFGGGIMLFVQKLLGGLGGGGAGGFLGLLSFIPKLFGFSEGGHVRGPGTSTSDSIPAMLSDGEFVINAKATARHLPLLEAINSGHVARFAAGGLVGSSQPIRVPAGGVVASQSVTVSPTINLTSHGGTPEQNADLAGKVSKQVTESLRALVIGELSNQMRHGGVLAKAMGR